MIEGARVRAGITVNSGGSGEPALNHVARGFREATGHPVEVYYNNHERICDVVVAAEDALERRFRPAGLVEDGGVHIGSVGLGVAVRNAGPTPDVGTLQAFTNSLVMADRLLITDKHTSGLYIESMLRKVGAYERVEHKLERLRDAPTLLSRLLDGEGFEFTMLSLNEIATYKDKGVRLVGLLPSEIQYSVRFTAVPMASSRNKELAWRFAHFCAGPGRPLLAAHGFT